ncbi:MAG: hypothetical protein ACXWP6_15800 [Ktedonobacterales bacterium]
MRILRWIEAISGILTSIAGGAAITFLLIAPTYRGEGCHVTNSGEPPICVTTTSTFLQVNGSTAIVDLSIAAALFICIAIAAVWHSRTGRQGVQWTLWATSATLIIFTLLAILSIGPLLLPGAALAFVASLCALIWPQARNHPADTMMPRHT